MPMVLFGVARAGSPLLPAKWPNDARPQELGRRFSGHLEVQRQAFTGYNVAAVVRGRDQRLNKSYLAYGAHYDHIGILRREELGEKANPLDSIANGADDDGSGSVALLAIARQMQLNRPRRSVLFVWHVAEEKGMLGSAYFTEHPTVPIDSIVAQFNADMIGRNEANTLALVGPRAAPNYLSWRLGMIVDSVNRAYPIPFRIDRQWDDPDNPEHIYQRSDHYNYAKKGIPIVFFTTGLHRDYHAVSDEASKIDYDKMSRIARLMLDAGYAVANRTSRPTSAGLLESVSSRAP
jgi:Zn-dependent M28 family amino/carboxypeptidase